MGAVDQLLNKSVVLFYRQSSIHLTPSGSRWVRRAAGWSSIRSHHYHFRSPAAFAATEHVCLPTPWVPQGHLHPPLLSNTELLLLWQPCCHGSIYFGADLDLGWLHIQPSVSDQMCHTYTLAWSAAGSRVSADPGWGIGEPLWRARVRGREPTITLRCKNSPPVPTSWQAEMENL